MELEDRLLKVMRKSVGFEGDTIDPEDDFFEGSLLLDSIDMLEIVLGIKKEFGLEMSVEKGQSVVFRNFKEMADVVSKLLAEETAA